MVIHFICTGNAYRSRLAEAYLNSRKIKGVKAISSGVRAGEDRHGHISWYAQYIMEKENLIEFSKPLWRQTTLDNLKIGDITIFMTRKNFNRTINLLKIIPEYYEIWDIWDLDELGYFIEQNTPEDEAKKIKVVVTTFKIIKAKIDNLLLRIKKEEILGLDNFGKMIHK